MSSPTLADALSLAATRLLAGDTLGARDLCWTQLQENPRVPECLRLLGLTFAQAHEFEQAVSYLSEALALDSSQSAWHTDLGSVYAASNCPALAAESFRRAYALHPRDPDNLLAYARTLLKLRQFEACVRITRALLDASPHSVAARDILIACLRQLTQLDEVLSISESLGAAHPQDFAVLELLSYARWEMGDVEGCLQTLDKISSLGLSTAETESFRLNALLHRQGHTPESIVSSHRAWAEKFCPILPDPARASFANSLQPDRLLRIGYVTGEFRCCPGYHFLVPLLRGHDRKNFEIFCYSGAEHVDSCGKSIQDLGHPWHDIHKLSDEELHRLFREHRIDIAVDLSGHFPDHRLPTMANRIAPVQVFYPNYPATSGVANIDYVVTDRWLCPPGSESNYSESVVRLPSGFIVHQPPGTLPVTALPARANGFLTFGLFQRPSKLNSESWDAIAGVLRAVPDSHLLIQYASALRAKFTNEMEARGVSGNRLDFRDWLPIRERVRLLGQVDIALDTFPYNGQTTTCECLWMGVPVVTRSGRSHVSRVASSILHQVGLSDWIADSIPEYVGIASRAAANLNALETLRATMRDRLIQSPLLDAARKARELEAAYRQMWHAYVTRATGAHSAAPTRNPA